MNENKNNRVGGITLMHKDSRKDFTKDSTPESCVKIVNLTPHAITVLKNGEEIAVYKASGYIARCESDTVVVGEIAGIPLTKTEFGELYLIDRDKFRYELPAQQDGTFYIVSALVARAAGREDFVIVNDTVRDNDGRIIGCQSFARV
ncbi:hypothetical protein [Butyricicoccus intestinisimiae]|uniref:Uncharacterized protein n=1 Tax=Butyricicoccus intestinisimiae TaxID=2841509 RepID=A0ABS6EUJ3_9FIRM|nr:hypothetical protein [Butyricicoccus intestinisimiae]MBU5491262.1 hypothetical protein [Butyricicoccus intestinisimiae]